MGRIANSNLSEVEIEIMCNYIKLGKSIEKVAEIMDVHTATVSRHTKEIIVNRTYKRVPKAVIVKELKSGIETKELADKLGVNLELIEKIYREKINEMPKKVVPLTKRQEEVKKIGEEVRRQKLKQQKEYELDLDNEKELLAIRFKGIVK